MSTLYFMSDGTVHGLYTESITLAELGKLRVERATAIEFDNAAQSWGVFTAMGERIYSSSSRQECLRWEEEHLKHPRERC